MDASKPDPSAMLGMFEVVLAKVQEIIADPETAERCATFTRNYYEALVAKGFTEEAALQIVIAAGLPSLFPGGK